MKSDQTDSKTGESRARQEVQDGPDPREAAEGGPQEAGAQDGAGGDAAARRDGAAEELEAMRDRYLRLAAEYDNYRKRTERERGEGQARAQAQVVERLLEPLDDLQRVAQFSREDVDMESLLEGVRMVERKLLRVLESAGLEVIAAEGERFDPELHEALMTSAAEDREEDETVGQVFQTGYRFRGQMLRPARVQVRKYEG